MKEKQWELLLHLLEAQECYITSKSLATTLCLSEKTIRTYIQELTSIVAHHGATIIAKPGYGYQLSIQQYLRFETFLKQSRPFTRQHHILCESASQRKHYLLQKLLLDNEVLSLDDISDALYVSRSTISKDFQELKVLLRPYQLQIVSKAKQGTWIEGSEQQKRAFIMYYFFHQQNNFSIPQILQTFQLEELHHETMIMIILEECRNYDVKLSDVMIQNLIMHLALCIKRIKLGFQLTTLPDTILFSSTTAEKAATKIVARLSQYLDIDFPKEEIYYLTLHLGAKNYFFAKEDEKYHKKNLMRELMVALSDLGECMEIDLCTDQSLLHRLIEHLLPMLIRIQQGIFLKNPLKEQTMSQYFDVFSKTKHYLSTMPSLHYLDIRDDEWAYLTLHILGAIERNHQNKKLRVLIICSTGYGSAQLLKNRVEKEFHDYFTIVDEIGYYELRTYDFSHIDLMISSVNLDTLVFPVPFLYVSVFLNDQDKQLIQNFIHHKQGTSNYPQSLKFSFEEKSQLFHQHITEKQYVIFTQPTTFEQVQTTLLKTLCTDEDSQYFEKMKVQIQHRASMGSILFHEHVAVPHPAFPIGKKAKIAIGIIKNGLQDKHELQDIRLVFLLSPSCIENQRFIYLTKAIVRLCDSPSIHELWEQTTFKQFENLFIQYI